MPSVKNVGEPYEGKPHVRFDGGELETGYCPGVWNWALVGHGRDVRHHLPLIGHRASSLPYRLFLDLR